MNRLPLLCLLSTLTPALVLAQQDSRLVAAVRLSQDGKGDSARAVVLNLLSSTPETDTLYPQIVYTMALVARDVNDRSRNFRRVAVEFAGSTWADDAFLGLAQEDFAAGRAEAAVRSIERIRVDYPTSPILPIASFWGARAYFELGNPAEACRWLNQGLALAGDDVELQNQLIFYAPRCSGAGGPPSSVSGPPAGERPSPTPVPGEGGAPAAGSGRFTVQVAAASTEAAAQSSSDQLRAAGYDPHIVREGGFIKVRVGRFASRGEAVAAASQIRAKLGGGAFVVEEQ